MTAASAAAIDEIDFIRASRRIARLRATISHRYAEGRRQSAGRNYVYG
jgi:hypothetical protein